ncbi:hypothetical protein [Achromobacter arsenitoxydans]|uniref:Uncharacterized protein n=1 Tax=Achromobacter arsenitoxydans SY8 TaxID=477184 RepID=H0FAU0_9BURK|nr:hypothetical protein [Achromobacter arsenitoxydans]EHK64608.1 hypothetical protein KYC_19484 [Achromobacter arsenitoxydans SY8]
MPMFKTPARIPHSWLGALALAGLSQITGAVSAAQRTVYAGELQGAGEVVMELDSATAPNGQLSGRYFYPKRGVDIPLKGTDQALLEPKPYWEAAKAGNAAGAQADAAATWQGTRDEQGYRGVWTDARTGKQRNFTLKRVAQYETGAQANDGGIDDDADINATRAPYEALKLAGHAVPVGPDVGSAKVAYRMWQDPRTKFSYPRLSRHPDAQVLARVNHLLEQRHWRMSHAALACLASAYTSGSPSAGTLGNYDEETIAVPWLSSALMTVTEAGSLDCGGAHPNNHFDPYTLDLLRGEYLDWNRIFDAYAPGDAASRPPSAALRDLVSQVQKSLAARDEAGMTEDRSQEGCWELWPGYLALGAATPGALSLSVSGVGHASGVCLGTQAQVPFQDLKAYLKPGGQAYLVTD